VSGVGIQRLALSMLGVSRRWQHRRGPERLLPRRASRQSRHIGYRADGPSGSKAYVVTLRVYGLVRWSKVCPWFGLSRGSQGSAAVGSAGPDPRRQRRGWSSPKLARSGNRSRYDGGGSTTSLNTGVLGGKPRRVSAHPTDRVLGGAGPNRSSSGNDESSVATPGVHARRSRSRKGSFRTSHNGPYGFRGRRWISSIAYRLHGSRFREAGELGVGCIGALALRCASVFDESTGFVLRARGETSRGFRRSRWQHR
jgi:hypothetical protein